jgi:hypothetical protein
MSQHDYNIANQTFPSFRSDLNNALSAIQTTNSGTSRPTGAVSGQLWLDTTSATTPTLKYYDGADDISLATIDHTANTVNWLDSTVSITGLSTTATGTVLTLSDSASTSTVNLIIDNQKEVRFRESTANGTNYVGLKAPASLSADLTYTLPSADGTSGQALITNGSGVLSFTTISSGTSWQSVQTTGFTAVSGRGYPCNTTSSAFTVTLPSSPSVGDYVQIVDYAGTFATNNLTLGANSNKINGVVANRLLTTNREGVSLTYVDSTQGWVASLGVNEGTVSLTPVPYSVDFLVIAGGGGGGGNNGGASFSAASGGGAGGYRNSYLTETSGGGGSSETELTFINGTVYTITVGSGGAGSPNSGNNNGTTGNNSSISGSGITTITSNGGGGGGTSYTPGNAGSSGGSGGGGGGGQASPLAGGSGTSNQGYAGGTSTGNGGGGSGGGGASAVGSNCSSSPNGSNGGNGLSSSITASSVTRSGGGGGGAFGTGNTIGTGGTGGGGDGNKNGGTGVAGTVNTGSGGGGGGGNSSSIGGAGGSGVVILRMPTASYSGTTTGSPTITTSGSDTIIVFNSSGTITG